MDSDARNVEGMSSSQGLLIGKFYDKKPVGRKYFYPRAPNESSDAPDGLSVGVAFYNEDPLELRRTLASLANQTEALRKLNAEMDVVLVGDGWKHLPRLTRLYLREIFCSNEETCLAQWDEMERVLDRHVTESDLAEEGIGKKPAPITFVVQRVNGLNEPVASLVSIEDPEQQLFLRMTLVLKADNRRKHNSAMWMMSPRGGFAECFRADFLLLTDCGTLFKEDCVAQLVEYMQLNEECSGCTARPRVMSYKEQNDTKSSCERNLVEFAFRAIQTSEYESSYSTYTAAFALVGMLPVLPGPCTMLRYEHLVDKLARLAPERDTLLLHLDQSLAETESPFDHFESIVEMPISETDLVVENMKIAEDRIPSYAVVTHARHERFWGNYTTWVTGFGWGGPVVKFQAETEIAQWITQRRRWINGAMAVYVWLVLTMPSLLCGSKMSCGRRSAIYLLSLFQLINYGLSTLATAVFGSALQLSLMKLGVELWLALSLSALYFVISFFFAWIHRYETFVKPLFFFVAIVNAAGISIVTVAIGMEISEDSFQIGQDGVLHFQPVVLLSIFCVAIALIPLFLAVVQLDMHSALLIFASFPLYILFLPTNVGTFVLYSIARLGDTSWGNRASSLRAGFLEEVSRVQLERLRVNMQSNAGVVLLLVTLANAAVQIGISAFASNQIFLLVLVIFFFWTTMIQALLSCIFFLGHHVWSCFLCMKKRRAKRREMADETTQLIAMQVRL